MHAPDHITQTRLRGRLNPSSHFQRDRRQTRQPALGSRPFSSLEVETSKVLSRSDLCWSSLDHATVREADLALGAHPSSWAPWPTPHLVISLLVCLKVKVFAPSHSHSVRLRLMGVRALGQVLTDCCWVPILGPGMPSPGGGGFPSVKSCWESQFIGDS